MDVQKALNRAIASTVQRVLHEVQAVEEAEEFFAQNPDAQEVEVVLVEKKQVLVYLLNYIKCHREGPDEVLKTWEFRTLTERLTWELEHGWRYPPWSLWPGSQTVEKEVEVARVLVRKET